MANKHSARFLLTCLLLPLLLTSCRIKSFRPIEFRSASEDAMAYIPGTEWAVVTEPIACLRADIGFEEKVNVRVRIGDMMQVRGRKIVRIETAEGRESSMVWYLFDRGWMEETSLKVFDNKMRAESMSKKLLEK